MIELNKITKLECITDHNPQCKEELNRLDKKLFDLHRDTRTQTKIRIVKTEHKQDRWTDYLVTESDIKHFLAGLLLILFLFYLLVLVI